MRLTGSPSRSGSSVVGIAPSAHYQGGSHHAWPNRIGLDRYCWCLSQIPTQLQMIRVAHLPATPIRCSCQRGDPRLTGPVTEVNRRSHLSSFVPSAPNVLLHGSYKFLGQTPSNKGCSHRSPPSCTFLKARSIIRASKRRWLRHPFIPLPLRAFDENAPSTGDFRPAAENCYANAGEPCFNALGRDRQGRQVTPASLQKRPA